jgi:phosphomannomutase
MSHRFAPAVLREYDIRGPVGDMLGEADARAVGRSFATRVRHAGGSRVAVGRDGRLSSPMLEAALVEGLAAGGVDVVRVGLGPTPMLYYAENVAEVDGGIQVTGSHNPGHHNGFKLMLRHHPFFGDDIRDLARIAAAGEWTSGRGRVEDAEICDRYVGRLLAGHGGAPFRVGWDTGNGAAGPAVEKLVQRLPGEHHTLFTDVDGHFPNHHPDPTRPENLGDLRALVAAKRLDFGLAFDGDGDRIGAVDAQGRVLWGDAILSILAEVALREMPGAAIVADVKAGRHLWSRVRTLGGRPEMARTGHSWIKTRMRELGAPVAGEMSGHIFFGQDWYGFDDALYAAVRLMRACTLLGRTLTELRDAMPEYATLDEQRLPVDDAGKFALVEEVAARLRAVDGVVDRTDGVRVEVADGWWLLRASNTEAALTVQAEADDLAALGRLLDRIDTLLAAVGVARPR